MRKMGVLISLIMILLLVSGSTILPAAYPANAGAAADDSQISSLQSDITRVDFVRYSAAAAKKPVKPAAGYKLMGVKWLELPVTYVFNDSTLPAGTGMSATEAMGILDESLEVWDEPSAVTELFEGGSKTDGTASYGKLDGKNAIVFGDYSNSGVIAVTSVWFSRKTKEIVEFDMLFNTDFAWGDAIDDPSLMDFQNIATHELGHALGLADIYTDAYKDVTMYGYATEGETIKRDLAAPDIAGILKIYGN